MRRIAIAAAGLVLSAMLSLLAAPTAGAHQHLFNPSGSCPPANSSVPQGVDNPAGKTPGGRNQAIPTGDAERAVENCQG